MVRDSRVLVLDEISAALDSVSEAALHDALTNVLQVLRPRFTSFLCTYIYTSEKGTDSRGPLSAVSVIACRTARLSSSPTAGPPFR